MTTAPKANKKNPLTARLLKLGAQVRWEGLFVPERALEKLIKEHVDAAVAECTQYAERYRWLKEEIDWLPPGYNGCKEGRFDMLWVCEEKDLGVAIDAALYAERTKTT